MEFSLYEIMKNGFDLNASDVHLTSGVPPIIRIDGKLHHLSDYPDLTPQVIKDIVFPFITEEEIEELKNFKDLDTSFGIRGLGRFRVNIYQQRGSIGVALRIIMDRIPTFAELGLPAIIEEMSMKPRGLLLVTGPTGMGKSTSLASMVGYINRNKLCHIITIEDPIEFLHHHGKGMVNQREVGKDTASFAQALRSSLREDPDVIMVGEIRDLESISAALTLAETGHLVLSTAHTNNAAQTIDRLIDVFPSSQQSQIRYQLSEVLEGVVSQLLLPHSSGQGRVLATELLVSTPAVRNLIREGKTNQILSLIQTGSQFGMYSMDQDLIRIYLAGRISQEVALGFAFNQREMERILREKGVYKSAKL
ncbi:MAG: Twitching mobility protein [candidate division WS2 bacterium]|uniref:Twitching mobility protein n=1 Tax=Psychracetigena formicireducens TaxID=2986056 RepID=A0A9E2BFG3_PSYF1|nr:Twitching mobility protein [Candidatus Psychracetigena formicireducens]MBT9144623.1 Twitching mobility protein [Candidatus Psychracetigena formicireducens]